MSLSNILDQKPLFYAKIDYDRMPNVYSKIKDKLPKQKIIHIVGTNGKGTTGRFLATALSKVAKTGHFTSPHISKLNERFWIDGRDVSDDILEKSSLSLNSLLSKEDLDSLSYFEYITLLSAFVFEGCEYLVLEAGLGGERDATAVFEAELNLFTPIALDHTDFLGENIKQIATTKIKASKSKAILGVQKYKEVEDIFYSLSKTMGFEAKTIQKILTNDDYVIANEVKQYLTLSNFFYENLLLCIAALKSLGVIYSLDSFKDFKIFGRLSRISKNICVDVGHNELASEAIAEFYKDKKIVLVYNSYNDKDFNKILSNLKPIIKELHLIDVKNDRMATKSEIKRVCLDLDIVCKDFVGVNMLDEYLVFGSFSVVQVFMECFNEKQIYDNNT